MKNPCRECPFKKNSLPGYLGECSHNPEGFLSGPEAQPCHLTVDYDSHPTDYSKAILCIGNLQFLNNKLKLSRFKEIANAQKEAGKNVAVFSTTKEFIEYHK